MKVQVTLSDEIVREIDKYVEFIGSTRSAFCALAIAKFFHEVVKSEEKYDDK